MKFLNTKAKGILIGFFSTWLICTPAWADDTEIYFGGSSSSSNVPPNVLFILDTSSSMNETDGGSSSRLERMKTSLKNILNTSQGINVGLMRFSNPGGPVLYPVSDIEGSTSANLLDGNVSSTISSGNDDAEQTPNGIVSLTSPWLELTRVPAAAIVQIETQVAADSDDAEESSGGSINLGSTDLELTVEGGTNDQKIGLRFADVNIPKDAVINDAWIEFTVDPADGGSTSISDDIEVELSGQQHDDPGTFSAINKVTGRVKTTARVNWNIPHTTSYADGDPLVTDSITNIVQELVTRSNWSTNNAMVLMLERKSGSGSRWVKTHDIDTSAAPKLHVSYFIDTVESVTVRVSNSNDDAIETAGTVSLTASTSDPLKLGISDSRAGIRFSSVDIPQGATIIDAALAFTVNKNNNKAVTLNYSGELAGNSASFSSSTNNLTSRAQTSGSVNLALEGSSANNTITSPDIKEVLQEIINLGTWSANNAMTLFIERVSGHNSGFVDTYSYEQSSAKAAELTVNYLLGTGSTTSQTVGLRFNNITVPRGATITSARVSFSADASDSDSTNLVFNAEDIGDSPAFSTTDNDLSDRNKTAQSIGWNAAAAWTAETQYQSPAAPDLSPVIQEVVNRTDWCGGNSLSLLVSGTGLRVAKSYERNPSLAPRLDITYDVPAAGSVGCISYPFGVQVNASSDDAEQSSDGTMNLDSSDLELVTDASTQTVGIRFNQVLLKQGVTVDRAYLEFAVDETGPTEATNLIIKSEASANSSTFTTAGNNISSRSTNSNSVNWNISEPWTESDSIQRSPDISSLINQVLGHSDWVPGNSLSLIISGSGKRVGHAYDGSNLAPRLVFYTTPENLSNSDVTVRQKLSDTVDSLEYKSGTPIVDTLYEAALYYRGDEVDYGKVRGTGSRRAQTRLSHPDTLKTGSWSIAPADCTDSNASGCEDEAITGTAVYDSPISESCQSNHIVLLTDGYASVNTAATKVKAMTGDSSCVDSDDTACGLELVSYLKNSDQLALAEDQTITTHTIGFNFSDQWLRDMADFGGGGFYEADSTSELTSAFDTIIKTIKAVNTTFVEPSVTINQFNRFSHRDDVYFALFKPQETAKWYGNLKKYQLKGSPATLYDNQSPQQPAIDPQTGFFDINSQSFWSSDEDGNVVEKGGAASKIPTSRKIFTNISSNPVLSASDNALHESNALLTKDIAVLDIASQSDAYRTDLLQWARGLDANGAQRFEMGDPLHSRPELITYDGLSDPVNSVIFFGTNEGFLHAVDINTGIEKYSFIPKELLSNLDTYFVNASTASRPYGLDGGITLWSKDANQDGDLIDTDDFTYLYTAMRRGGRSYYALDVSNINAPELMWQIDGGSGDFVDLGQTWSKPIKSKIRLKENGPNDPVTIYDVLIFGGGYDTSQDSVNVRTADAMGNAVYIVNAETGALIWSAGNGNHHKLDLSEMVYSIPSEIRVIDINRDGAVDQLYFGDMGGQVWRADVDSEATLGSSANGYYPDISMGRIADLAVSYDGSGNALTVAEAAAEDADAASTLDIQADNRRFFYPPDVALAVDSGDRYLSVSIGSGYRAHPLDTAIEDRFYMIKQYSTHAAASSYTTLTEDDLYDATANLINQGDTTQQQTADHALSNDFNITGRKEGWYLRMENSGEKVLAGSATIQNQIVFTTYEPSSQATGTCNPTQGTSRAYLVSLFDASPMLDIDGNGSTNSADRVIQLQIGSIPATPTVIDTLASKPTVWVGPERLDQVDTDVESVRTYWIEENN
ncbi:MAG: PilC/PilY family type IV pilus protein [Motiliproteus sp.]